MKGRRGDPLRRFFAPYFNSGGQIFILSAPRENIRDGLAAILIARHFGLPEHEKMTIEPSRLSVKAEPNVILVGRASLFAEHDKEPGRRTRRLKIRYLTLGPRIAEIYKASCYAFGQRTPRNLINRVNGSVYKPTSSDDFGKEVDFGVIRRIFRSAAENTIMLEGVHGLGTLGAAMVATTPAYLTEIWDALGDDNPSCPIEVLVRTTFDALITQGVYAPSAVEARPLKLVYNSSRIYDFEERVWTDMEPWALEIVRDGASIPPVSTHPSTSKISRLEVEADLRPLPSDVREMCRRLLSPLTRKAPSQPSSTKEDRRRLLAHLTDVSGLFEIRYHELTRDRTWTIHPLPIHPSPIREQRKKYLLHLILCSLLDERLFVRNDEIKRLFPEFCRMTSRYGDVASLFIRRINGKMRQGFDALLGPKPHPKGYALCRWDPADGSYRLVLEKVKLVVRLRV